MSDESPSERLSKTNEALAAWAARSACESESLIELFENMGYEVRGKSEEEIAATLKEPPTKSPRA